MKQLLIISGKGGTGKTTIAGAFIRLSEARAFADCDVDAPNLHLMYPGMSSEMSDFYGMPTAVIYEDRCVGCDVCRESCRFDAIRETDGKWVVDPYACEGCGLCAALCPEGAVRMEPSVAGDLTLYRDNDRVFSSARLRMGSGTSGKLVSRVKRRMIEEAPRTDLAVIDGSPGIGCPVVASMSGVHMALVVTEPSISGLSDLERIVRTGQHFGIAMAVCVNRWDINEKNTERIERYCEKRGLLCLGRIPFDEAAGEAINRGITLVDVDCPAGMAVRCLFDRVLRLLMRDSDGK
ncbi:MAG: ATPase [Dethiosulfovibrio peptidovorans]|nr:MAG: ATPase [Dethiosulfovibrio peptidovorans]